MNFIDRKTGEVLIIKNRRALMHTVLSSVYLQFMLGSQTMQSVVRKYKNAPLVPYVMTERDKEKVRQNPDAIEDIPRFVVKGYDKEVSDSRFDQRIWDEFYDRYKLDDPTLCDFINTYHPVFRATIGTAENHKEIKVSRATFIDRILRVG